MLGAFNKDIFVLGIAGDQHLASVAHAALRRHWDGSTPIRFVDGAMLKVDPLTRNGDMLLADITDWHGLAP